MADPSWQDGSRRTEKTIQGIFGHGTRKSCLNGRKVSLGWSVVIEALIALAPWLWKIEAFRRSGRLVEGSRTGLTLDKHLKTKTSTEDLVA